jgi:hypothetical protein
VHPPFGGNNRTPVSWPGGRWRRRVRR